MRVSTHGGAPDDEQMRAELALGALLPNRYRIDGVLGRGGSGVVFDAYDRELRRRVAVKVLHHVCRESRARMLREAQICAQLQNEHIVRVYDVGYLPDGVPFLVMEHLEGEDLSVVVARGPLEVATAIEYLLQTCSAVELAHAAGIVHRDLKPANLFVSRTNGGTSIKVLDFGLSKPLHGWTSILAATITATVSGTVIGTPAYMSPEQLLGHRDLDVRTDVWSLGVVLFELATGVRPFVGDSFAALAIAIATSKPRNPALLRPELPQPLIETIRCCLAKSPSDRLPTVSSIVDALRAPRFIRPSHPPVRRSNRKGSTLNPAIRAAAVRDTLDFLDKFEPGSRRRVLERVPAASRDVIAATPRSAWVSIEHDHWLIDAMIELFGPERAIQCWRDAATALAARPLLRNFISGTVTVLGRSPASVVRIYAKGWRIVYRDLCEPKLLATADGQPTIRFESIAPEVQRYTNYLHCWHGACQSFVHIAQVRGDVRFEVSPDFSWAEAKFFWQEDDEADEVEGRES